MSEASRFKRPRESDETGNEGDANMKNLNNLPDHVLVDIISRLKMKEAIRTSVLSKRWEYLWTSKSDFEFKEGCNDKRYFKSIVDGALASHNSSSINEFRLSCKVRRDGSHIKTWVCAAVKRNVHLVHITLNSGLVLPSCLLTCGTLTSLCLNLRSTLSVPTSVCLSALKFLDLACVKFSVDNSIQKLLSGCPVLEKLEFCECNWTKLSSLSISAPMLQSLEIIEYTFFGFGSNPSNIDGCQVAIFGTNNLKSFTYCGALENEYCIYNSPAIENVHLDVAYNGGRGNFFAHKAYKLMNGLANAEKLILIDEIMKILSDAEELLPYIPMFQRLAHLQLEIRSVNLDCKPLLKLLRCSHYLKTLDFNEGISLLSDFSENDNLMNPVPHCLLNEVKSITIEKFSGNEKALQAVELLLKNALVLENMTITCIANSGRLHRKVTKLSKRFPKGSESCKVIVYSDVY